MSLRNIPSQFQTHHNNLEFPYKLEKLPQIRINNLEFPSNLENLPMTLITDENKEEAILKRQKSHRENVSQTIILPILKKFIYILKKGTPSYKFKALEQKDFDLLNDKSFYNQNEVKISQDKKNFLLKFSNFCLEKCFGVWSIGFVVFHPYNNFKIIWDMIHFIAILGLFFIIPINICFQLNIEADFKVLLAVFFTLDMLMNMNTSYFFRGFLVKKRGEIILHYFKNEFFIDLLTLILYYVENDNLGHFAFFKLLFLLRWAKLGKINSRLQEKFKIGLNLHSSVIDLINLMFFSFYILNIFACLWYYIARIYESQPEIETWITSNHLTNESLINIYFYSLYWSTVTVMTVGYGDISATNILEVVFCVFTVFFGCGLFAYFINSVGAIVQNINKEASLFKEKMEVINKYMDKKKVSYNLQMKIREYLRFIWREESTQNVEIETEIINKLSKSLKSELIYESYGKILRNSPLFFANFSEKFLSELMYEITEVRNIPEDFIFHVPNFILLNFKLVNYSLLIYFF